MARPLDRWCSMNDLIQTAKAALFFSIGALAACTSRAPRAPESEIQPSTTLTAARVPPTGLPPARAEERPAYDSPAAAEAEREREAARSAPLSDAQALGVFSAVDEGMVALGELGQRLASSGEVRELAQLLIAHHRAWEAQTRALESATGLSPDAWSDAAQHVRIESASAVSSLEASPRTSATSFDRLYLDTVIRAHRDVLGTLERRVLPGVGDARVERFASTLREGARAHLARAESLRGRLDAEGRGSER